MLKTWTSLDSVAVGSAIIVKQNTAGAAKTNEAISRNFVLIRNSVEVLFQLSVIIDIFIKGTYSLLSISILTLACCHPQLTMNQFTIMIVDGPWHGRQENVIRWTLKWNTESSGSVGPVSALTASPWALYWLCSMGPEPAVKHPILYTLRALPWAKLFLYIVNY